MLEGPAAPANPGNCELEFRSITNVGHAGMVAGTVMLAVAVNRFEPQEASIVLVPPATPSASPLVELIVTTVGLEELQITVPLTFWELPSL
jgi:hypothetical protein